MPRSTKRIFLLMVRYPGPFADAMVRCTRYDYTHATIGLEEDLNTFYSFMRKGFVVEKVTRYLKPGRDPFPCALYEIPVSRKVYKRVKKLLNAYTARKKFLRYTHFSLFWCFLRIPWRLPDRYFCSQFVAEVLQRGNVVYLPKNSAICLPKDFHNLKETRLVFSGNIQTMVDHYHLAGAT